MATRYAFGTPTLDTHTLKKMALEKPTQLNEKRLQVRKPDGWSNVEYMLAMRDGRRRLNGPSVGGDRAPLSFTNGDMPTEEDLNGWSVFVPQGGSYDVFLSSGIHPKAPPSRFTVKPTADQPSMKKLIAVCIALLVGACGVLHYNFADVRPSFAGSMHGIGYHEWVGGAGSSGRRRTPYSFKEQATAQGMKFATQLHRDYMPQLRAGNDDSSSALLCSTSLTTAPSLPPTVRVTPHPSAHTDAVQRGSLSLQPLPASGNAPIHCATNHITTRATSARRKLCGSGATGASARGEPRSSSFPITV